MIRRLSFNTIIEADIAVYFGDIWTEHNVRFLIFYNTYQCFPGFWEGLGWISNSIDILKVLPQEIGSTFGFEGVLQS